MRIDKAEVIVTSPDRNFVTLRLTTDDGLVGLGDATAILGHAQPEHDRERLDLKHESSRLGYEPWRDG